MIKVNEFCENMIPIYKNIKHLYFLKEFNLVSLMDKIISFQRSFDICFYEKTQSNQTRKRQLTIYEEEILSKYDNYRNVNGNYVTYFFRDSKKPEFCITIFCLNDVNDSQYKFILSITNIDYFISYNKRTIKYFVD